MRSTRVGSWMRIRYVDDCPFARPSLNFSPLSWPLAQETSFESDELRRGEREITLRGKGLPMKYMKPALECEANRMGGYVVTRRPRGGGCGRRLHHRLACLRSISGAMGRSRRRAEGEHEYAV